MFRKVEKEKEIICKRFDRPKMQQQVFDFESK